MQLDPHLCKESHLVSPSIPKKNHQIENKKEKRISPLLFFKNSLTSPFAKNRSILPTTPFLRFPNKFRILAPKTDTETPISSVCVST